MSNIELTDEEGEPALNLPGIFRYVRPGDIGDMAVRDATGVCERWAVRVQRQYGLRFLKTLADALRKEQHEALVALNADIGDVEDPMHPGESL